MARNQVIMIRGEQLFYAFKAKDFDTLMEICLPPAE